jgi:hypothetical protein
MIQYLPGEIQRFRSVESDKVLTAILAPIGFFEIGSVVYELIANINGRRHPDDKHTDSSVDGGLLRDSETTKAVSSRESTKHCGTVAAHE